jgi:hypothetical protein
MNNWEKKWRDNAVDIVQKLVSILTFERYYYLLIPFLRWRNTGRTSPPQRQLVLDTGMGYPAGTRIGVSRVRIQIDFSVSSAIPVPISIVPVPMTAGFSYLVGTYLSKKYIIVIIILFTQKRKGMYYCSVYMFTHVCTVTSNRCRRSQQPPPFHLYHHLFNDGKQPK